MPRVSAPHAPAPAPAEYAVTVDPSEQYWSRLEADNVTLQRLDLKNIQAGGAACAALRCPVLCCAMCVMCYACCDVACTVLLKRAPRRQTPQLRARSCWYSLPPSRGPAAAPIAAGSAKENIF